MEAIDLIDILAPEHDRTTCSDKNPCNGLERDGERLRWRCDRCMLLELAADKDIYGNEIDLTGHTIVISMYKD